MQVPGIEVPPAPPRTTGNWLQSLEAEFLDVSLYSETLIVLSVAVVLGSVLAYHPSLRRKITSRAEYEQPKTMVMYALVGALVGHIVALNQTMALVIFGIGGLLRFRTIVGEAKDTGRVILAAIVGICCGLQTYLIAALSTGFAWVIIWYLERQMIGSVQILGLDTTRMQGASDAYRWLLTEAGCKIISERRSTKKGEVELVFRAPAGIDDGQLRLQGEALEESRRGVAAWEFS
jgi:hypothetical protein